MRWRSIRLFALVILGLVLAAVPTLVGCGESETENKVITIGVLADFSGPAAFAVVPTVDAFEESIKYYQEQDPIKGVAFKFVSYDHGLNYAKTVEGYQQLKADGMNILFAMGPTERDILQTYVEEDQIPVIGSQAREDSISFPWIFNVTPTQQWQGEAPLQWIAETWDYSKGVPKIGHQGYPLNSTDQMQLAIDRVLNDPAFAGKFDFVGFDRATMTNVTWTPSYEKFKDCDYVFNSTVGNSLATFVSQMRSLGYQGTFITNGDGFAGYWGVVQKAAAASELYDCYYPWWGPIAGSDSSADWYQELVEVTQSNHSDWNTRLSTTGPLTGFVNGKVTYEAVKNTVDEVGADKIDGEALRAGFAAVKINFEGTGNEFQYVDDIYTGFRNLRLVHWNVDAAKWEYATDKWYEPLYLS
jgi:ABC-type branched-subunit amino acid transport system substrate-binding protein